MGNVHPSQVKGQPLTTGNTGLVNNEKKLVQHQNEVNSRTTPQRPIQTYIREPSDEGLHRKHSPVVSPTQVQLTNGDSDRSESPILSHSQNIRLTKDVNNSRPNSRSTTPVLSRKPAMNPHRDQSASHSTVSSDQHRSNSSNSLKDAQAKDIMISYSHLDKEIMLRLKGMTLSLSLRLGLFSSCDVRLCHFE